MESEHSVEADDLLRLRDQAPWMTGVRRSRRKGRVVEYEGHAGGPATALFVDRPVAANLGGIIARGELLEFVWSDATLGSPRVGFITAKRGTSLAEGIAQRGHYSPHVAARLVNDLCLRVFRANVPFALERALAAESLRLGWRQGPRLELAAFELALDSLEEKPNWREREASAWRRLWAALTGSADLYGPDVGDLIERRLEFLAALASMIRSAGGLGLSTAQSSAASAAPQVRVDEDVQVTVFRPRSIVSERWYQLLAFVHVGKREAGQDDPLEEIERRVQGALGEQAKAYRSTTEDARLALPEGGNILLVPLVEGVEFNPPSRAFAWYEAIHEERFQLRARAATIGQTLRGKLSAYLGTVLLAEVTLSLLVAEQDVAEPQQKQRSVSYRKIFASYSHQDARVVRDFERVVQTFGDRYLIDVKSLRAGEVWSEALERLIAEADIFQLFWSESSMRSQFCRQEWEYALEANRDIRPVYWQVPMPRDEAAGLPPAPLARLHFAQLTAPETDNPAMQAGERSREPALSIGEMAERARAMVGEPNSASDDRPTGASFPRGTVPEGLSPAPARIEAEAARSRTPWLKMSVVAGVFLLLGGIGLKRYLQSAANVGAYSFRVQMLACQRQVAPDASSQKCAPAVQRALEACLSDLFKARSPDRVGEIQLGVSHSHETLVGDPKGGSRAAPSVRCVLPQLEGETLDVERVTRYEVRANVTWGPPPDDR